VVRDQSIAHPSTAPAVAKLQVRRAMRVLARPLLNYVGRQVALIDASMARRLDSFQRGIAADVQTVAEVGVNQSRLLTKLTEQLEVLGAIERRASTEEITAQIADLANWLESAQGYAAQSHLWFNPPISLEYRPGQVRIGHINERIVELPFVLGALTSLPRGSRILDFGSSESLLSLHLATQGYRVTALDLRPYPISHPLIDVAVSAIEVWPDPPEPYDAIVSLSTLQHVGLSGYGQPQVSTDPDREVMTRFRRWLRPKGLLILTAPFGRWEINDFQRVYDLAHLERLLEDFHILERRFAVRADGSWTTVDDPPEPLDDEGGVPAVVMLSATP
jgi:2-polyprenyl-3-methyl-5-hydroxy-6-metoxy-1,4-benzoquinol methylase